MARIPEEEIARLKSEISLQHLAEAKGVVLRKRGEELMGLCPFHEDHSPSLVINPAKNVWHCLGACQSGGTVIDWVMKAEEVSFRHAVEILRKEFSPLAATAAVSQKVSDIAPLTEMKRVISEDADDQQCLRQVLNYYTATLKESPDALAYLQNRGINSAEAVELFRLGYANRTLGYHIPFKSSAEGAELRGRLQRIGVYRKSGHEHFSGSLVIPVTDENSIVHEVYGRKLNDNLRKGTPLHLYLPGPHRGVWNVAALKASREIILCESLIDALTFWCAGFRNVTAAYGIEGFTDDHLAAFKKHHTERVLIAYDRDEPGERAASSLAAELMTEGIECFRIQFPRGMDANEYALQVKPAEKSLELVIRNAEWMGKGERPKVTMQPVSIEAGIEATKEERDDSKYREAVNPPPCPIEEERPEINTGPAPDDDSERREAVNPPPMCPEEPLASPIPPAPRPEVDAEVKHSEVTIQHGDRRWRVRGLEKNLSFSLLKVNLLVARDKQSTFHVDTFDLYSARQRQVFIKQASEELCVEEAVIKRDLGKILLKLEELQDQQINRTLQVKEQTSPAATVTGRAKDRAMEMLKDPHLLDRILSDFEKCGVVGEETNKLVGYLAAVSRKLEEPLAIVIQSSSAAGKSSLMEAILSFFPIEERVQYSAMTGQSLFYMGEADLQHKILAIAEEEGAEKATYALKLLQSEGELTIASTGKDPSTGRLETQEYRVEGPVMIFLTTTAIEIDEELLNRCIVLTVDEEREQTRAIHRLQRERQTLEGLLARRDSEDIRKLHQDAQRLLLPLLVANPYARELTFLDDRTRTRRDHMKYLTLIRSIALLHQYQRPTKHITHKGKQMAYIEVTLDDIEIANRLAHQVLGRSLDELSPQTRRLLRLLDEMVSAQCTKLGMEREDYRFTRREIRETTGWSYDQVRVHLDRLVALEYVLVHNGGRGQQFVYELQYEGQGKEGDPFLMKLIDVAALRTESTTKTLGGKTEGFGGSLGPHLAPIGEPLGDDKTEDKPSKINGVSNDFGESQKIAYQEAPLNPPYSLSRSPIPAMQAKGAK